MAAKTELTMRPVNILRNLFFSKGDYSKVRRQPSKKHWTKLHFTFLYTHYINQYTAKDTVGKEYGDLAANIGPRIGPRIKTHPLF